MPTNARFFFCYVCQSLTMTRIGLLHFNVEKQHFRVTNKACLHLWDAWVVLWVVSCQFGNRSSTVWPPVLNSDCRSLRNLKDVWQKTKTRSTRIEISFPFCGMFIWITETFALVGCTVHINFGTYYIAKWQEHLGQFVIAEVTWQMIDEQIAAFGTLFLLRWSVCGYDALCYGLAIQRCRIRYGCRILCRYRICFKAILCYNRILCQSIWIDISALAIGTSLLIACQCTRWYHCRRLTRYGCWRDCAVDCRAICQLHWTYVCALCSTHKRLVLKHLRNKQKKL